MLGGEFCRRERMAEFRSNPGAGRLGSTLRVRRALQIIVLVQLRSRLMQLVPSISGLKSQVPERVSGAPSDRR